MYLHQHQLTHVRIILLFSLLLTTGLLQAQDVHWSQFYDNPILLNPSNAGNFKGTSRVHLNYRDQWRSVTKAFSSFSLTYDSKFRNKKEWAYAITILNDKAGDGKFKTIEINVAPSYEKILNRDTTDKIRFGLNLGFNSRNYVMSNFEFDEQYNGTNFDPNLPVTEDYTTLKKSNLTLGLGSTYTHRLDRKKSIEVGLALFNINQPNQGFYGEKIKRDMRLSLHSRFTMRLKDDLFLMPQVLFQLQGTYKEFDLGAQVKKQMKLNEKENKAIYAGIFYRMKDAIYLNAGLDYNAWYFGVSYDINTSTLKPASAGRGGFELVTKYIFNRFKPKQTQHRVCPEFI